MGTLRISIGTVTPDFADLTISFTDGTNCYVGVLNHSDSVYLAQKIIDNLGKDNEEFFEIEMTEMISPIDMAEAFSIFHTKLKSDR